MRDAGQAIRTGFFNALDNQVDNPDNPAIKVPVVDEKLDANITQSDLFILIGGQAENPVHTKSDYVTEEDLSLTVVNRRKATNSKTLIENISDQILAIVFPDRLTYGVTVSDPFKISYVKKLSANYSFRETGDGFEISKVIVFRNRITQS